MPESDTSATASIGVQRAVWADLPPHLAVLLAPPAVVTTAKVPSSEGPPVGRHRHSAR